MAANEKCRRNGCYTKVAEGTIACGQHRGLISANTLDRIRDAAQRRDWPAKSVAVNQAVDELNGSPRPAKVTDAMLEQWLREAALS